MGHKHMFGHMYNRSANLKQVTLSPFEQRAFAKAITFGLPNLIKRFVKKMWIPPVIYGCYRLGEWLEYDINDSYRKYRLEEFAHIYKEKAEGES